jgi:hypothetical protein
MTPLLILEKKSPSGIAKIGMSVSFRAAVQGQTLSGETLLSASLLLPQEANSQRRYFMSALVPWRSMREMDPLSRRMDEMFDRLTPPQMVSKKIPIEVRK